ncbi:hypothetical protein [Helicobacter sp.]|uniref:hypothetical protein n=1 Tax=Helicobacter sp. TaxID=218 RepID=UPI0025C70902|nr:hypothetical protein [Helicobacter sp.]MCI5632883.1 hypothetical protein [Helicobacter sp.]
MSHQTLQADAVSSNKISHSLQKCSVKALQRLDKRQKHPRHISFLGFLDNSPLSFSKVLLLNPFACFNYSTEVKG